MLHTAFVMCCMTGRRSRGSWLLLLLQFCARLEKRS